MKLLCSASIFGLSVAGRFHLARSSGPGAPVDIINHERTEPTEQVIESAFKDDAATASLQHLETRLAEAEGGSGWTPAVGDSWNYNLDTPVKRNVDVDVFLIDMGKHTHCRGRAHMLEFSTENPLQYIRKLAQNVSTAGGGKV